MGYLLPALTDSKFGNQRDVVLNERRQNYENRPRSAPMAMVAAFPPDRPITGRRSARSRTCAAWTRRGPAVLQHLPPWQRVAGAGGRHRSGRGARARPSSFEELSGRPYLPQPQTPVLVDETRLLLEDRVELPRVNHLLAHAGDVRGETPISIWRDILANGKTSRLYKRLVSTSASPPTCRRRRIP